MNLFAKDDLSRLVSGGIRGALNEHGTITYANYTGVTRRVTGYLLDELLRLGRVECADAGLRLALSEAESELREIRKREDGLRRNRRDLLKLLQSHGISPADAGKVEGA